MDVLHRKLWHGISHGVISARPSQSTGASLDFWIPYWLPDLALATCEEDKILKIEVGGDPPLKYVLRTVHTYTVQYGVLGIRSCNYVLRIHGFAPVVERGSMAYHRIQDIMMMLHSSQSTLHIDGFLDGLVRTYEQKQKAIDTL